MTSMPKNLRQLPASAIVLLTLLTVFSLGMSAYCAKNRLDGYNYRLADYATIYVPQEAFAIVGLQTTAGAVTMQVTGNVADGKLLGPASSAMELADGAIRITGIPSGTNEFKITSESQPDLRREFAITSRSQVAQITSSSVLIGRFDRLPLQQLATQRTDYDDADVQRAVAKLAEHSVAASGATLARLAKLWQWLYPEMEPGRGVPPDPDWLRNLPAYGQYEALSTGKASGYCTHMAEVYNLFGTVSGVAMRVVDVNGRLDGVNLTNHTFNEVWVPEQERWAYSDLQAGVLFVRDANSNRVVNAVQICQLTQAGAAGSLIATTYDPKTKAIVEVPYEQTSPTCRLLLNPNATFVYHRYYPNRGSTLAWLDRYLLHPELAFMMQAQSTKHRIKLGAAGLLVACMATWCYVLVRVLRRRRRMAAVATT